MKRKFFVLGLFSLSLFSCKEDPIDVPGEVSTVSIVASLENGRVWEASDEVLINGAGYVISDGAGTSLATIDYVAKASAYCAAYDFGSGSVDGNMLRFTVPSAITAGHSICNPMVACNTGTLLSFKYLLGTLKLSFTGSDAVLTKLVLYSASDEKLCGEASVNLDFVGAPSMTFADGASSVLNVNLGDGVNAGSGSVEIPLPTGSYNSLMVTAYDKEGNVMTAKPLSSVEIKRGEVSEASVEYTPDAEPPVYITAQLENDAIYAQNAWNSSSLLYVNGLPASLYEGEGSGSGVFGPVSSAEIYYVSTSSASVGSASAILRVEIPSTQYYGKPLSQINPAVGYTFDNNVSLKYIGGVMSVTLSGKHTVREVELISKSNNVRLSGGGVVNLNVSDFAISMNADAKNSIVLNCGAGVDITGGETFNFVLPAVMYSDGFALIATDSKGQIYNVDIPAQAVPRNQLTSAGSFEWASDGAGDSDLSLRGYSNCYMVNAEGSYSFATNKIDNTRIGGIESADWLWASKVSGSEGNALISDVKYADGRIWFNASANKGNALIAAFDKDGNIVWSWHIWMTDMPEVFDYENNPVYQSGGKTDGFYVMDRNLGATGVTGDEAFGLFYQWGRKDPFIGDTESEYINREDVNVQDLGAFARSDNFVIRNTKYSQAVWQSLPCTDEIGSIAYATAHPMLFIYAGEDSNVANWVTKENLTSDQWWDEDKSLWTPNEKSIYDPCPVGYQVPKNRTFETLKNCGPEWPDNQGVTFTLSEGVTTWFPYQGYRSAHSDEKGSLTYTRMPNGQVEVWTSHYAVAQFAYSFLVSKPAVFNYDNQDPWGNGLNVRCVRAY